MADLKEKKKLKSNDRFKPVPNPNYKPLEKQSQASTSKSNSSQSNATTKTDSIENSNTLLSPPKAYSVKTADNMLDSNISRTNKSDTRIEKVRKLKANNMQIENPNAMTKQLETSKPINIQADFFKTNIGQFDEPRYDNSPGSELITATATPQPSITSRISPLYAMTPQLATTTLSRRPSKLSPPPLPTTPRPGTASLMSNQENKTKKKLEERWTISSNRKLEKLPVRVSNPKLNERNSRLFSSKPLPIPPKHTEFRTSSGFENLEFTTSFYQPSLTNQPSWISDQNYKWNQSQQNERAFELTQNK